MSSAESSSTRGAGQRRAACFELGDALHMHVALLVRHPPQDAFTRRVSVELGPRRLGVRAFLG